jgi:hypothetical protein
MIQMTQVLLARLEPAPARRRCDWIMARKAAADPQAPMSVKQADELRRLARDGYELEAFQPHLTCAEAQRRIAMLTAKLKLMDEPPHTL